MTLRKQLVHRSNGAKEAGHELSLVSQEQLDYISFVFHTRGDNNYIEESMFVLLFMKDKFWFCQCVYTRVFITYVLHVMYSRRYPLENSDVI